MTTDNPVELTIDDSKHSVKIDGSQISRLVNGHSVFLKLPDGSGELEFELGEMNNYYANEIQEELRY